MARFGDETAGADDFPSSSDRALLSRFELTEAGDVSEIVVRFTSAATAGMSMKGLIYADGAGVPGARIAVGAAVAVPAGGGLVSSATTASLAAGFYWLGYVANSFEARAQGDTGGSLSRMEAATYASPAATWVQSGTGGMALNVYAEYTPAAPPFYRNPFTRKPRGGGAEWFDASPASALLLAEFFEPAAPGVPTYTRGGTLAEPAHLQAARGFVARRGAEVREAPGVVSARLVRLARAAILAAEPATQSGGGVFVPGVNTYTRAAAIREAAATAAARMLRGNRSATVSETATVRAQAVKRLPRATRTEAAPLASSARTLRAPRGARADAAPVAASSRRLTLARAQAGAQAVEALAAARFVRAIRAAILEVASPAAIVGRALRAVRAAALSESPEVRAAGGLVSADVLPGIGSMLAAAAPRLTPSEAVALRAQGAAILARLAAPSLSPLPPPALERVP